MAEHQRVSFAMTHKSSKKGLSRGIGSGDNSDHVQKDVEFIDSLEDQQIKRFDNQNSAFYIATSMHRAGRL